jgi:hypothetical protein
VAQAAAGAVTAGRTAARPGRRISAACLQEYAAGCLAAAEAHPKRDLLRRDLRLARLDMTVWFASQELANLCQATFIERGDEAPDAGHIEVYAMDPSAAGWESPAAWDDQSGFSSRQFDQILDAGGRRGFYHHDGPSWQLYDRASGVGVQTLASPLGYPAWESSSPLRLFLHWAYAARDMRLAHGATLGLNGTGVLMAGPSGSGKSGTTLAGLLYGLDSVGDDYVVLESGPDLTARAVFPVLKQDREGLQRAGIAAANLDGALPNWRGKIEFDARTICAKGLVDQMRISALFIPRIARARRTTVERASMREAALAFAPSAVFQLPGDAPAGFRLVADIVRRLPAYRVSLSEDPREIAGAIGSFLAGEGNRAG